MSPYRASLVVDNDHKTRDSLASQSLTATIKDDAKELAQGVGKLNILDFIVGSSLITIGMPLFGVPAGMIFVSALVFFRLFQKPAYHVPKIGLFLAIFFISVIYISYSSYFLSGKEIEDIVSRVGRMSVVVGLVVVIADQRVNLRSFVGGLGLGLVFNAVAFYAGIAPDTYNGALSGWLGDKNVAGLYYAITPFFLYIFSKNNSQKILIFLTFLPLLWLTGSRTSIAAFMIAIMWIFFSKNLNAFLKLIFAGFVSWIFEWLQRNFADSALFGDRTGTDWFREQIDIESWEKVQSAPWNGLGLGEAFVTLESGRSIWFHNSYWTLFVEGGWPWTIVILSCTVFAGFIWKQRCQLYGDLKRNVGAEAAIVLLAICSWRLGEVILTAPWGIAIGLALYYTALPAKGRVEKSMNDV
ncbi:O-antigen ligase family protein [Rothia sp. ZJ1223]|uniref:O-antigen ligase family protein n=1 Tax=Rothia sp. ZJ1223 TaxID=2811098 RepID=UPI001959EBC6|nr:O-antigen ligase family protein [Rothia sp. ZJ1223]MBM7051405.1 O-antigen ligase family protein [Rothia sp. ZJ1223]